jgi:hypothetical protein
MKNLKYLSGKLNSIAIIVCIASTLVLSSCQEVIEIDLNSSNPVLVVEGQIVKDSTVWIKLSYTTDYFNNEEMVFEENASVVLTNGNNDSETLDYFGDGLYKGNILLGEVDENYNLDITTGTDEYTAGSTLMPPSEIYEIVVTESDMQRPGQDEISYSLEIKFKDVTASDDFYMMKFFINGLLDSYALVDDKIFLVGDTVSYPVIRKSFYENDEVIVRLHTVDNGTFNYYNQLSDAISDGMGPGGSSTPYNPASNFGEDVLGYFAAWSYVSDTVVVQ